MSSCTGCGLATLQGGGVMSKPRNKLEQFLLNRMAEKDITPKRLEEEKLLNTFRELSDAKTSRELDDWDKIVDLAEFLEIDMDTLASLIDLKNDSVVENCRDAVVILNCCTLKDSIFYALKVIWDKTLTILIIAIVCTIVFFLITRSEKDLGGVMVTLAEGLLDGLCAVLAWKSSLRCNRDILSKFLKIFAIGSVFLCAMDVYYGTIVNIFALQVVGLQGVPYLVLYTAALLMFNVAWLHSILIVGKQKKIWRGAIMAAFIISLSGIYYYFEFRGLNLSLHVVFHLIFAILKTSLIILILLTYFFYRRATWLTLLRIGFIVLLATDIFLCSKEVNHILPQCDLLEILWICAEVLIMLGVMLLYKTLQQNCQEWNCLRLYLDRCYGVSVNSFIARLCLLAYACLARCLGLASHA